MLVEKKKTVGIKNGYYEVLTCDTCNSSNIAETTEGFACKECGTVLEIPKLAYHSPYDLNSTQHARLNEYTNIGSQSERINHPYYNKLKRFQKQQIIVKSKKQVAQQARIEIGRIFSVNNYPNQLKEKVFLLFTEFRKKIKERSKYRSVEKLVPISIYFCFKLENIPINESELLETAKITKKDFSAFKLQVYQHLPEYKVRNRETYVLGKVYELMEYFNLDMGFYLSAQKILTKLWNGIKNTSDLVIAGLVSSISILCSDQNNITINALCKHLGIQMSTIQKQVEKRIFNQFKIDGFISLIKSSSVLKRIMIRLGIIEENNSEIKLGNAVQVFNRFKDYTYCAYLIANRSKLITFTYRKNVNFDINIVLNYLKNKYELTIKNLHSLGIGHLRIDSG